jgi:hypothetical protein
MSQIGCKQQKGKEHVLYHGPEAEAVYKYTPVVRDTDFLSQSENKGVLVLSFGSELSNDQIRNEFEIQSKKSVIRSYKQNNNNTYILGVPGYSYYGLNISNEKSEGNKSRKYITTVSFIIKK